MRLSREVYDCGRDPARLELVHLRQEDGGIDDAARPDDADLSAQNTTRDLQDLEGLPVDDNRVRGVRAALVATDEVGVEREQVDDLAFTFVSPLRTDDHCCGHG